MATTAAQDEYNNLFRDKSRRTAHPEDDAASFLDDNSEDESGARTPQASSSPPLPTGNYKIPTTRHQSNTGPKGVITDAQAYRDAARSRPSMNASRTSLHQLPEIETPHWNLQEDIDEELEDDDGFMQEWRKQRLAAMSGASKVLGGRQRERSANRTRFGALVPVDGPGFLDAVDGSGSVTVVLVFIWDDRVSGHTYLHTGF